MHTAAILPVKRFPRAKQRLAASFADQLRQRLAGAMVADVLAALAGTSAIEQTIVVTLQDSVAHAASTQGAIVIPELAESGQSAAVARGIEQAIAMGMERVLCIPGDCPWLSPDDLDQLLLGQERQPSVLIVPDRHGTGTNGLLLAPCDAIQPSFGPGSFERHRELALRAGLPVAIARPRGLLLDIDTSEDLSALRERLDEEPQRASHTRALLTGAERLAAPLA